MLPWLNPIFTETYEVYAHATALIGEVVVVGPNVGGTSRIPFHNRHNLFISWFSLFGTGKQPEQAEKKSSIRIVSDHFLHRIS